MTSINQSACIFFNMDDRYAVIGKKREIRGEKRESEEKEREKHTVMKNITRKGYYDTKGGQEKVT